MARAPRTRARVTASLKSMKGDTQIYTNVSHKLEKMGQTIEREVREKLYEEAFRTFKGAAGRRIEAYRQGHGTNTSPKTGNKYPDNHLYNSIDKKIVSGRMQIFIDPAVVPYAAIHDKPEGSYTMISAKRSKGLSFYFHKAGRFMFIRRGSSIARPGTGFFTSSLHDINLRELAEEIVPEVVEDYNRKNRRR